MQEHYKKGIKLSRNHKKRTEEDSQELYAIIEIAVEIAKDINNPKAIFAIDFLVDLFEPLISRIAEKTHKKIYELHGYDDIRQEVVINFLILVNRYDKTKTYTKTYFTYYIQNMLGRYVSKWVQNEVTAHNHLEPLTVNLLFMEDNRLHSQNSVYEYLNNFIINKDYIEFMLDKSKSKSKSITNNEICLNYFLGSDSCGQIANRLNISYHAVYQKINDIKEDLADYLNTNKFFGGVITSTGFSIL